MQDYRKLKVWEKAHAFSIRVHALCESMPRRQSIAVATQLRRAARSIPANIAEGCAKGSDPEFRRFLRIAMGSAMEADYHSLAARDTKLIDHAGHAELELQNVEIRRMLGGLIKALNRSIEGEPNNGTAEPQPQAKASKL